MNRYFFILLALFPLASTSVFSQSDSQETVQIQPTIMVIPYTKEGEDLRTVFDEDIARRVAVTKVKEGFDNRGFTTVDFVAKLKAYLVDGAYTSTDLNSLKSELVAASGADIYVEVEAHSQESSSGNSARIILTAYDAFTGRALGNKTSSSPKMYTDDFGRLVEKALSKKEGDEQIELIEAFLNVMQEKFTDIIENGRAIKVIFTLDGSVEYDYDSELANGELLSDEIDLWMEENAYKGNFHLQGMSNDRITYDEVRIPLRDERNRNYTPRRFSSKVLKFCRSLDLLDGTGVNNADRDVRGGTIYISLQ